MARILIVDDIIDMAQMLQEVMGRFGYDVDICSNGEDAIRKIQARDYDLIITDIVMPERDGLELSRHIRENLAGPKAAIPIIAISGGAVTIPASIALSAARQHVDRVLLKPVSMQALESTVKELLAAA